MRWQVWEMHGQNKESEYTLETKIADPRETPRGFWLVPPHLVMLFTKVHFYLTKSSPVLPTLAANGHVW